VFYNVAGPMIFFQFIAMNLIKLIATFLIIYLVFRFFTMYLLPVLIRWYLNRFKKRFYEQNPHLRKDEHDNTTSNMNTKKESGNITNQIGEYVDFEEIKDEKKDKK
jgi:hypothetical protein